MDARNASRLGARFGAPALTILIALAAVVLLLLAFSSSFGQALGLFFLGPFKNTYYFGNMLNASAALILTGLGASLAFAAKNFNLGGEGQVYLGAIATVIVGLALSEGNPLFVQAVAVLAAMATGAFLGWVSGFLKRSLAVDELISSFLLSSGLIYVGDFLITGPFQDQASNFQTTASLPEALRYAKILPPSALSTAVFLVLAVLLAVWFLLARTRFGFELGLTGKNREFARYCGVDTGRYAEASMALSGALNGLAGAVLILGTYFKAMKGFSAGIGWSGIAVALLAGNRPLAVLPAALFLAYLDAGATAVMVGADVTSEIVSVIQAVIFFLVTAKALDGLFRTHGRAGIAGGRG